MFVCPECKVENRSDAKFCRKCGRSRADLEKERGATSLPTSDNRTEKLSEARQATPSQSAVATSDKPQLESITTPASEQQHEKSADFSSPDCPVCWTPLRSTDKFCCWCGAAQPNRVLPFFKLCLECSTQLPEKANFCFWCGADVCSPSRRRVRVSAELFRDEESEFFPRFDA